MRKGGLALLTGALALSGCGALEAGGLDTTEKSGRVGSELADGGTKVTLVKVKRRVPKPEGDVSGLASPAPGTRFFGVLIKACNDSDQAIKNFDFDLARSGGGDLKPRFPQQALEPEFDSQRSGCGRGWLVFQLEKSDRPEKLKFRYDDTGSGEAGDVERHARFTWKVG